MKQIFLIVTGVLFAVGMVVFVFAYLQAAQEELELTADLQYRTRLLADGLKESIEPSFVQNSTTTLQRTIDRFANRERLLGIALYDTTGQLLAASSTLPTDALGASGLVGRAMDSDSPQSTMIKSGERSLYLFVDPLHQEGRVIGAFMVVQNADYIDASIKNIWMRNLFRLLVQAFVFAPTVGVLIWFLIYRPLLRMTESVKVARTSGNGGANISGVSFITPLAREISKMTHSLSKARSAASEEARLRLEKLDTPWTEERLKEFIKAYLKDRPIFVVSNREPYVHTKVKNEIRVSVPASGLVTALESVMAACGGTWIAYGSGNADREIADQEGKLAVPPDDPKYTLKRVWLTQKDVQGHYLGFSNEALWPLSHMAHTRPIFRKEDWLAYRRVNGKFAEVLLAEIRNVERPLILVQDYHFALLPMMIKRSRPDAQVALFWHIPWPNAEAFSICPFRKEILEGMLGADILGFHTQQYCNNFLETVGKEIEALLDFEHFSITMEGHRTYVKPFPISIAFTDSPEEAARVGGDAMAQAQARLHKLGIRTEFLGLGVDRLDYTKGILERFKGVEHFLDMHPAYRKRFTFLQIAPLSREGVTKYREYNEAITEEAERINARFAEGGWEPIVLEKEHYTHDELRPLYRRADLCLVTPVHDGMNLVAKEFVAARDDEAGVLILSQFTGAARDLKGALPLNPYSAEETADAIYRGLTMPPAEQHRRMKAMRAAVKDYNVYRWAAELIKAVANL